MSNVTLPAIGTVIATESASGAEVQVVRLDIGGVGGISTVSEQNPIPVFMDGAATEAKQDAQVASLNSISSAVSTAEKQDEQAALLDSIAAAVATAANQELQKSVLDLMLEKMNSGLLVTGYTNITSAEFTRPANATAYSAMDSVANDVAAPLPISFENSARVAGGSGYVTKAKISTNVSTNNVRYRLNLYSAAPVAVADNALFTRLWAERANLVGWIDFDGMTTEGAGSNAAVSITSSVRLPYKCAGTALFGLLETRDAFTPTSGQQFSIELTVES